SQTGIDAEEHPSAGGKVPRTAQIRPTRGIRKPSRDETDRLHGGHEMRKPDRNQCDTEQEPSDAHGAIAGCEQVRRSRFWAKRGMEDPTSRDEHCNLSTAQPGPFGQWANSLRRKLP